MFSPVTLKAGNTLPGAKKTPTKQPLWCPSLLLSFHPHPPKTQHQNEAEVGNEKVGVSPETIKQAKDTLVMILQL